MVNVELPVVQFLICGQMKCKMKDSVECGKTL